MRNTKTYFALVTLGLLLSVSAVSVWGDVADDEKAIVQVLDTLAQATIKKDVPTLNKIYREDLTYGHSTGLTQTKDEVLKAMPGSTIVSMKFSEAKIRTYGSVAVVKVITDIGTRPAGTSGTVTDNHLNILWVLVKGNQGWQVAARQTTRIAP